MILDKMYERHREVRNLILLSGNFLCKWPLFEFTKCVNPCSNWDSTANATSWLQRLTTITPTSIPYLSKYLIFLTVFEFV